MTLPERPALENQWPKLLEHRQSLARHLVHEMIPAVDVADLLNMFAVGLTFTHDNGILQSKGNIMFASSLAFSAEDALSHNEKCTVYASQLVSLAFHIVFCAFKNDIRQIPCMLYQKTLLFRDPACCQHIFYTSLYSQVLPLLTVPPAIAAALHIGRPDLQNTIMTIYMTWLKRVKRPEIIQEAVDLLMAETWNFDTTSPTFACLQKWVEACDIQIAIVGTKCTKTDDLADLTFSRLNQGNISIDNHAILVASKRDRILLLMLFLFDNDCGWAVFGLPDAHLSPFPSVFATLQKAQPFLFDCSLPAPPCLFDELDYLQL